MKIYVAASFEQKEEAKKLHNVLTNAGHTITLDWTTHKLLADAPNIEVLSRQYAIDDVEGVMAADVYVLILGERKSAGSHIELGIALGANIKHIYILGEVKDFTLFYKHPRVKNLLDVESLIKELSKT